MKKLLSSYVSGSDGDFIVRQDEKTGKVYAGWALPDTLQGIWGHSYSVQEYESLEDWNQSSKKAEFFSPDI